MHELLDQKNGSAEHIQANLTLRGGFAVSRLLSPCFPEIPQPRQCISRHQAKEEPCIPCTFHLKQTQSSRNKFNTASHEVETALV